MTHWWGGNPHCSSQGQWQRSECSHSPVWLVPNSDMVTGTHWLTHPEISCLTGSRAVPLCGWENQHATLALWTTAPKIFSSSTASAAGLCWSKYFHKQVIRIMGGQEQPGYNIADIWKERRQWSVPDVSQRWDLYLTNLFTGLCIGDSIQLSFLC